MKPDGSMPAMVDADKWRSRQERAVIDAVARGPVLHFFISALFWLLAGSAMALIASIN